MTKTQRYSFLLIAAVLGQGVSAPARAAGKSDLIVQEKCVAGDPLCVERGMTIAPVPEATQPGAQSQRLSPRRVAPSPTPLPTPASHAVAPIQALRLEPIAPPLSRVANESHQGGNTTYEFHDGDGIGGNTLNPRDFITASLPRPKLIMPPHLECQLPEEVTNEYGFDRKLCLKPSAPLKPEVSLITPTRPKQDGPSLEFRVRAGMTAADIRVRSAADTKTESNAGVRSAAFRATAKEGNGAGVTLAGQVNQSWINTPTLSREDAMPIGHAGVEVFNRPTESDPRAVLGFVEYTTSPQTGVRHQFNVGVGMQVGFGNGYWTPSKSGALDPGKGLSVSSTARVQYSNRQEDWVLPTSARNVVDVLNLGTVAQYCITPFGNDVAHLCPEVSAQATLRVGEAQEAHAKLGAGLRLSIVPRRGQSDSVYKPYAEIGAGVSTETNLREGESTIGTKSMTIFAGGAF